MIAWPQTTMPRSALVLLLPGALTFAPTAAASEPAPERTLFGRPVAAAPELTEEEIAARRAAFEQHLADNDLVHAGNLVIPRAQAEGTMAIPPRPLKAWEQPPHRQTIFLNFFGGTLKGGTNASEMESPCVGGEVEYPQFAGSEQDALAIIQVFKDAVEPYGLRLAYAKAPPRHLPYSMVMMGGKPQQIGLPQGVLGVACNLDCADQWWRDTTFAFTDVANDIQVLGTTALQEAAHAWGLDHIDGEQLIMHPFATFGKKVWANECTPYNDATGPIGCKYVHDEFCGENGGKQNDDAELLAFFGPNSVDDVPPTVVMTSPLDGQVFEPGSQVAVKVEVSDNFEGFGWRLVIPEIDQEQPVYNGQTEWTLSPPKGAFTIRVEAIDHDLNVGFAEAKIYVGVEAPVETTGEPTPGEGESSGAAPTTGGEGGEEGEAGSSGASGDTAGLTGGDDDDKGCACTSGQVSATAPVWLLVLGAALRRRRRA